MKVPQVLQLASSSFASITSSGCDGNCDGYIPSTRDKALNACLALLGNIVSVLGTVHLYKKICIFITIKNKGWTDSK